MIWFVVYFQKQSDVINLMLPSVVWWVIINRVAVLYNGASFQCTISEKPRRPSVCEDDEMSWRLSWSKLHFCYLPSEPSLPLFQLWQQRRMGHLCLNSHGGESRGSPSQRWWMPTRRLALSSTLCPSALSSSPWISLTTRSTAPSSTTRPSCRCTEELQPSTGEEE